MLAGCWLEIYQLQSVAKLLRVSLRSGKLCVAFYLRPLVNQFRCLRCYRSVLTSTTRARVALAN